MARIATLLFAIACGGYASSMQMRETVERTVMVRTTGSDLQPAATGYIYKKDDDGPASLVKMGETEVMEHLSKIYQKPEAYKAPAPAPAGPFPAKDDEVKAASYTKEDHVKPVHENEEHDGHNADGIANEDYDKIFEEYSKQFKDDKGFGDYLHGLGHYDHDTYHGYGGDKDYDDTGYHGYGGKGYKGYGGNFHDKDHGDYQREKHEGYSISKEGDHKGFDDADGKRYGLGYKGDDDGTGAHGFHKVYDHKEYKKDFYGAGAHDDGHGVHGSGYKADAHLTGLYDDGFRNGGFAEHGSGDHDHDGHSSEQGGAHHDGDFGAKDRQYNGKSYGFEIKH